MIVGSSVPKISFACTDPNLQSFADLRGKNIVLYFYPKDNTPLCTRESNDFNDVLPALSALNTQVIGVSRDNMVCHQTFQAKRGLAFPLISDPDEVLCRHFGVIIQGNPIKRFIFKIERSTFFIDKEGILQHVWHNVKVKGHAQAVLHWIQTFYMREGGILPS